jgi:sugar/nucleoside kinase (ribokinase family)
MAATAEVGKSSAGVVAAGGLSINHPPIRSGAAPPADGSALRAAVGAWLVGVQAAACAVVDDAFPTDVILDITRAGIDLSRLRLKSGVDGSSNGSGDPTLSQLARLNRGWSAHVCRMALAHQRDLVRALTQRVAAITLDAPFPSVGLDANDVLDLATNCDAFLIGSRAAAAWWPGQPHHELLRLLARRGVRVAVIKLGVGGSIAIGDGVISWMPAFPVTASGMTGGGDAYAGAFAAMYAADRDLPRAMAWATAAASTMVESFAALDPLTEFSRSQVEHRARILGAETKVRNG